jgi:FKBP-type peptidyl-prolyl cis-trans isomerase 2
VRLQTKPWQIVALVIAVEGVLDVSIDTCNHPLAGMNLHFDVKVVEVREATAEGAGTRTRPRPGGHPLEIDPSP